jgi:hypothetical protein
MARGGYRPGAGRPKKSGGPTKKELAQEAVREATSAGMTPLEYMLSVMNDRATDPDRRDKMAVAAAPYVHAKADTAAAGKKEQRQANAEQIAQQGRFQPRSGPRLAVIK